MTPFNSRRLIPFGILAAVVLGLYVQTLSARFNELDDYGYIVEYGHYDRPLNASGLYNIFFTLSRQEMLHDYYRPVYTLIRTVDYHLHGTSPAGYHVTNILFYLLAVWMVYLILLELLGMPSAALAGALLFAAHPLHVEAVSWVMAGGYAISGAMIFGAYYLFLRRQWAASVAAYVAACLANPPAVVLPALLVGQAWLLPSEEAAENRSRRHTLVALIVAGAGVVLLNLVIFPQHYSVGICDTVTGATTCIASFALYLWGLVGWAGFEALRQQYISTLLNPWWIAGLVLLLSAPVVFVRLRAAHRWLAAFALYWFAVSLLPTVALWRNVPSMAGRYTFTASFAMSLLVGAFYASARRRLALGRRSGSLGVALVAAFIAYHGAQAWFQNHIWHDTETMTVDNLKGNPGNAIAARILARYYALRTRTPEKGLPYLDRCIQDTRRRLDRLTRPKMIVYEKNTLAKLLTTQAGVLRALGRFDEAFAKHRDAEAVAAEPDTDLYFERALTYDMAMDSLDPRKDARIYQEDFRQALSYYQKSIELNQAYDRAYQNMALLLTRMGRPREAIVALEAAHRLSPNNLEVLGLLARTCVSVGQTEQARLILDDAIARLRIRAARPDLLHEMESMRRDILTGNAGPAVAPASPQGLLASLFRQRRFAEALEVGRSMERQAGGTDVQLFNNIGLCLYQLHRDPEAEAYFRKALAIQPEYLSGLSNLSLLYARAGRFDRAIPLAEKALALHPDNDSLRLRLQAYRASASRARPPSSNP